VRCGLRLGTNRQKLPFGQKGDCAGHANNWRMLSSPLALRPKPAVREGLFVTQVRGKAEQSAAPVGMSDRLGRPGVRSLPASSGTNFRLARHSGRISAIPGAFRNVQVPSRRSTQCSPVRSISRPHKKLTTCPRETSWWPGTAVVRADDAGARKNPYWAELLRACVLSSATSCWKFELGRSFSRSGSAIRPSASLYPRLMASRKYCCASSEWLAANCPAKILSP